jgi:hypothetical protein
MTSQTPKACTRIAMAAAFVLAITAACGDDTQGHALADTIEKLGGAAIDRADFRPGNLLDPAEVYVGSQTRWMLRKLWKSGARRSNRHASGLVHRSTSPCGSRTETLWTPLTGASTVACSRTYPIEAAVVREKKCPVPDR